MRLLLVEDSIRLQHSLGVGLRKLGYALDITGDGAEGLWLAQSHDYDAIVLDLMLPSRGGLSVLMLLRNTGKETPILILTSKDTIDDRVRALELGADDYLVKPFAFDELAARVQSITRRRHGLRQPRIALGNVEIDTVRRKVFLNGVKVYLTRREFAVLEYLAIHQQRVVTRTEIESHIYDQYAEPMSNVVDAAVCSLRRKLDQPDKLSFIQTCRGTGYFVEAGAHAPLIEKT